MIRRHVRILTHDDEMVFPSEIQYSHEEGCDFDDPSTYGKPTYASYYYQKEDFDTGELLDEYVRAGLKLFKYEDSLPVMHNLGPKDVNEVLVFEKDIVKDSEGVVYLVDYDKEKCYYYLETSSGVRKPVSDVDLTTFTIVGNIYRDQFVWLSEKK